MANRRERFSLDENIGTPSASVPISRFLPQSERLNSLTSNIQDHKESDVRCEKKRRIKRNLYLEETHCSYIDILAGYRGCGPGAVIDDALSRFFSCQDVISELKEAFEAEQRKRDNDRIAFDLRFENKR